ncbi:MAG: hypothetical protein GWP05_10345 [Anaerolineaceae bacterium]|nr:hypothetical protein [Anaerolineaceae bacterium]
MAKRVAAQRRGLLYGLIGVIGLSIIMSVLFFIQLSKTNDLLTIYDPDALQKPDSIARVQADLNKELGKLADLGILPDKGQVSVSAALKKAREQNEQYKQAIDELSWQISMKSPSDAVGEQLLNFVKGQIKLAGESRGEAKTALAIVPPLADVKDVEVIDPTSLQSAITGLKTHIRALVKAYKTKQDDLKNKLEANNILESQLDSANKAAQAKYDEAVKAKDAEIAALGDKVTEVQKQSDAVDLQREAVKNEFIKFKQDAAKKLQEKVNRINELTSQVNELITQIDRATTGVAQPDGKIVSLMPGDKTGYIDLAAGDAVFNNLTFKVYDPQEIGEGKEKGYIRIVNVMKNASEFVITSRKKTDPIVKGDVVVNIAYDRDRRFHFAVIGRFDINGDGQDDTGLVKSLIERFGGKVDDKLNVRSDYLVVGDDPMTGFIMPASGKMTPGIRKQWEDRKKEQQAYGEASELARRFWIPVLNQNRFLTLIGIRPIEAD